MLEEDKLRDDCEGLTYLRWSMFDSPDKVGSGKMFMEREPVLILDDVIRLTKMNWIANNIKLGYTSKWYADRNRIATNSSHRVGRAITIHCVGNHKRGLIVKALFNLGIKRIGINKKEIYFDTDDLKKPMLSLM